MSLAWTCALVAAGFGFGNVPDKLGALGDDHLAIGLGRFRGRGGHEISRLFFYASTGCESLAFTAVPFEWLVEFCPAFANEEAVLLLETCAPDLPASADVLLAPERLAYAPVQAYAAASPQERARKDNRNWGFIVDGLLHDGMGWFTGTYELVVPIVVEGMNLARAVLSDRS